MSKGKLVAVCCVWLAIVGVGVMSWKFWIAPIGADLAAEDLQGRGLLFEAEKFTRGNLTVETSNYGKGIGVLLHAGHAEYELELPSAGRYQLEMRYAAQESRPIVLSINGKTVKKDAAREITGGWQPQHQRWHLEGVFTFKAASNVLRLERGAAVPHLDKILVIRVEDTKATATDIDKKINANTTAAKMRLVRS